MICVPLHEDPPATLSRIASLSTLEALPPGEPPCTRPDALHFTLPPACLVVLHRMGLEERRSGGGAQRMPACMTS